MQQRQPLWGHLEPGQEARSRAPHPRVRAAGPAMGPQSTGAEGSFSAKAQKAPL